MLIGGCTYSKLFINCRLHINQKINKMRLKNVVLSFLAAILISCTENSITNAQIIENLSVENFKSFLDKEQNRILIDVRTPEETATGHLKDATLINYYANDFMDKIAMVRRDVPIFIYCRSGGRSSVAAKKMKKIGFAKIYNMLGGIGAWNDANFSIVKPTSVPKKDAVIISIKDFSEILKNNTRVLVDFHTRWCVPCKKLEPIIDEIASEDREKVYIIKIDADENKHLIKQYNVKGVPTLILFENGADIWRNTGLLTKKEITAKLNR